MTPLQSLSGPDLWIYAAGLHSLAFALFHSAFWKLFDWKRDLGRMSRANGAILQILNLRLIYVFLLSAALCLAFGGALLESGPGLWFAGGMALFWAGRLIEQFVFLPMRGPRAALVHGLSAAFLLGVALFAWPTLRATGLL